jgi:hypothetical protein
MANDVVGGIPVALVYCMLCGSGILYTTARENGERWLFGSSGLLYRSSKLMYDQATHSLWNQFSGRPVVGPLTDSGIRLEVLPVAITSWAEWREQHPQTLVLSLETGHERDYLRPPEGPSTLASGQRLGVRAAPGARPASGSGQVQRDPGRAGTARPLGAGGLHRHR